VPTIGEIIAFLDAEDSLIQIVDTATSAVIHRPAPIAEAAAGEIAFCSITARNPQELLKYVRATLLIIDGSLPFVESELEQLGVQAVIVSKNARLDFIRVVRRFFAPPRLQGIHPTAVISPSAKIAAGVYVGPLCSIGEAEVGEGTVIHSGVHIYDGVRIGKDVVIHSGTVIGADGFGYQRNERGELEKFPHVGGVVIEDNVEIGANACIDRGSLGDTHICEGARIDNLVHVAHNVYIGKHSAVVADAMVGGGTRIGNGSWIAPSACLRDRIVIGEGATIGLGALVTKDVPKGTTVLGSPAREQDEYMRLLSVLRDLLKSGTAP
jgi:UDP-3-O-[3-hydroxymyristoyl] glucosamine N-acyltransferase